MKALIACVAIMAGGAAAAQSLDLEDLRELPQGTQRELQDITTETVERISHAPKAVVRALDRLTGQVEDLELIQGRTVRFGHIDVALGDCRYPVDTPASDAYAYLVVQEVEADEPAFQGWMVASSPALNALDHPRYDIWVLRCATA